MAKTTEKTDKKAETKPKETVKKKGKRYVFPRQGDIKCPECGLCETVATSTQGPIQHRKCTRAVPICTHPSFKVKGREVKEKPPEEKITDCK